MSFFSLLTLLPSKSEQIEEYQNFSKLCPTPTELASLVGSGSADVKLNPGNTAYDYAATASVFNFKVRSTKTIDFVWYRSAGSPALRVNY